MFVEKGYCQFCGSKCRHLKLKKGMGFCKKQTKRSRNIWWIKNEKTGYPIFFSSDPRVNIKAPKWCPKSKQTKDVIENDIIIMKH